MRALLDRGIESVLVSGVAEVTRLPMSALLELHPENRRNRRVSAAFRLNHVSAQPPAFVRPRTKIVYFGLVDHERRPIGLPPFTSGTSTVIAYSGTDVTAGKLMREGPADLLVYFGHAEFRGGGPSECMIELEGRMTRLEDLLHVVLPAVMPSVVILGACGVGVLDTWSYWRSRETQGPVECCLAHGVRAVAAPLWPQFVSPLGLITAGMTTSLLAGTTVSESLSNAIARGRQASNNADKRTDWPDWAGIGLFGDAHARAIHHHPQTRAPS
jgi:hypothetical protein